MIVEFQIEGQTFTALNGGPLFKFNEAISFQVNCETQEELDATIGEGFPKEEMKRRSNAVGSKINMVSLGK